MVGKLILAVVSEIIDTKNGNNDYKVLVFESTVSENDNEVVILDYEAKVIPTSQAKVIEKAMKEGKTVKMNAVVRQ
tara:strand:- start:528 stop:755 length:228 start_codon:yes stop_codon:yes gene_type:complete